MNRRKPVTTKKAKKKPPPAAKSRRAAPAPPARRRTKKPAASAPAEPRAPLPEVVPAPVAVAEPEPPIVEPEPAPPEPLELDVPLSNPEALFAERAAPAELDRPYPVSRRAIFFDVENTSRAQHIARVIEHLQIDRRGQRTEFVAVGNWRVIGHDTARLLSRHGAHLVHSAPSVGVRDWSDLRIAVGAGAWLAGARPGDVIEIVSDDRAFDAVGDVASSLGITYHRLSYRGLAGAPAEEIARPPVEAAVSEGRSSSSGDARGQRYRGRFRGRRDGRSAPPPRPAPSPAPAVALPPPPAEEPISAAPPEEEPHTAPHDEIVGVVRDLMRGHPGRGVSIDAVANALKARGFSRPPGSPRLITRLRRLSKELEINRAGIITLVGAAPAAPASASAPSVEPEEPQPEPVAVAPAKPAPVDVPVEDEGPGPGNERRVVEVEDDGEGLADVEDEGPGPGNEKIDSRPAAAAVDANAQRRRRRGGRRWHGRGRPQTSAHS